MNARIKELRERRAKLHADARVILSAAEAAKRDLTAEERTQVDAMYADVDKLKGDVDRLERAEDEERALGASLGRRTDSAIVSPDALTRDDWRRMFRAWACVGSKAERTVSAGDLELALRAGFDPRRQEIDARALVVATATQGGSTVGDEPIAAFLEVQKWFGAVQNVASRFETETGADLPIPVMNDTANTGEIVAENGSHNTTTDPSVAIVTMKAYKYSSKAVLVSVELLQDASFDIGAYLMGALGTRLGRIKNTHFTTGDNSTKPQGFVPGATVGKTAAATNAFTWAEVNDLMHSVDPAYRKAPGAAWMANDVIIGKIRQLNYGGSNQPVWEPATQAGEPDRIFGFPVIPNNDMDSAVTTGKKILAFGNFPLGYAVRTVRNPSFLRLAELYAASGQVAFLAFERADGRTLDTTAIKVLALA